MGGSVSLVKALEAAALFGCSFPVYTIAVESGNLVIADSDRDPAITLNIDSMECVIECSNRVRYVIVKGWTKIAEDGGFKVIRVVKEVEPEPDADELGKLISKKLSH